MEALKSKNVLVVEDDEHSYLYLFYALEDIDYKVYRANNGQEAIQIFSKQNINFEFVLMDLKLPDIDGYQACAAIRKIDPSVIVIAQTASYLPQIRQKLKEYQFNTVIIKPYTIDQFYDVIEETLSHKISKFCML